MGDIHRKFALSAATCLYLLIERLESVHLSNPSSMTCDASDTFILTPHSSLASPPSTSRPDPAFLAAPLCSTPKVDTWNILEYYDQNQAVHFLSNHINHHQSIRQFFNFFSDAFLPGRWNFNLLYHLGQGVTLVILDFLWASILKQRSLGKMLFSFPWLGYS